LKNSSRMLIASLLLGSSMAAATDNPPEALAIKGALSSSIDDVDFSEVDLRINGQNLSVGQDGSFRGEVLPQPYYQLAINGDGVFDTVHTFSITELSDADCHCLKVPVIDVIAHKDNRVELFFAGDAMAGRRFSDPIWNERQLVDQDNAYPDLLELLEPIRPYVETADIASVNLEAVLSDVDLGEAPPKLVVFYSPPELAQALADAGFDYVSLGNNHSYDYLEAGLDTTIKAVEDADLLWSGAGYNESEALRGARMTEAGHSFSILGYVGWAGRFEPNQIAEAEKGGAAHGTLENIRSSVSREAEAGFIPIAQLHDSREYSDRPTELSEERMRAAIDAGALIVASHHPHVTQGIERYGNGLIAYSLGNFLFDQYFMLTHASYGLKVWVEDEKLLRAEVIPLRILDYRPVPAVGSVRDYIIERTLRLSRERNTQLRRNGGHLILDFGDDFPVPRESGDHSTRPRELIFWGDFENSVYGPALDRTFQVIGAEAEYTFEGLEGTHLSFKPDERASGFALQPSTFFRSLTDNAATVRFRVRTTQPLDLSAAVQLRPKGVRRFEALESAAFETRWDKQIGPDDDWQMVEFCLPRQEEVRPYRLRLSFNLPDGEFAGSESIHLNDLMMTEGCELGG